MFRASHALVLAAALLFGCKQYRVVPVHEASRLSYENLPPSGPVVVTDVEGQRVRVESFRYVDVHTDKCRSWRNTNHEQREYCYVERTRFLAPLRLEVADGSLSVTPNRKDRRHENPVRFDEPRHVVIVERSPQRTLIIAGTAAALGLATAVGTSRAVSVADADDPHGLRAALLGLLAGSAVAGVSLAVTFPLTRDLGDVVE